MNTRSVFVVALAAGTAASIAWAGPHNQPARKAPTGTKASSPNPTPEGPGLNETFDTYAAGTGVVGQGGWQLWDATASDAIVDAALSFSNPNSALAVVNTDIVQVFDITSGRWVAECMTYMPSSASGTGYFIMLDTFSAPYVSGGHWSIELGLNGTTNVVTSVNKSIANGGPGPTTAPLIEDEWVKVRVEIDLDTDTFNLFYGTTALVTNGQWSFNASNSQGAVRIQCIDLYSTAAGFRWDNVTLLPDTGACYANCDGSTTQPILNVADFSCFLTKFAGGDNYANCDGSTTQPVLNVADFSCFLTKFAGGC